MGWLEWLSRVLGGSPAPRPEEPAEDEAEEPLGPDGVAVVPIEAELDLHHFSPRDLPSVVEEYLRAAHEKGLLEVTLIHGRGKGVARARVARILERHPLVSSFGPAGGARALGATVARLVATRRARG